MSGGEASLPAPSGLKLWLTTEAPGSGRQAALAAPMRLNGYCETMRT